MMQGWDIDSLRQKVLSNLSKPKLMAERAKILTKSYESTKGLPQVLRRALGLKALLENMTIYIQPYELIVGNLGPEPFSAPVYPECSWKWVVEQLEDFGSRGGDRFEVSEETKKDLRETLPKWDGLCVEDVALALMPESVKKAREAKLIGFENMLTGGIGHYLPGYDKVLTEGFAGFKKRIQAKLKTLDIADPEGLNARVFYEAALVCCEAACNFARRYAALAEEMASGVSDDTRREQLLNIARICRRVPEYPAETFYEALQSLWIAHIICYINQNGLAVTLGRTDQYLYPYYQRDVKAGILNREKALELLVSFWIKCNEIVKLYNNLAATYYAGFPVTQAPQVGGYTDDGRDGTNELSELILEAEERVRLPQPDVAVLYTPQMDQKFIERACRVVPKSMKPKFFNTDIGIQSLLSLGVNLDDVRDFAFVGCVEQSVPGKTWGWHNAGLVNLAKCLELALNDGIDNSSGQRIGPSTGKISVLQSMEDVWNAFKIQTGNAVKLLVAALHAVEEAHRTLVPLPYESLLIDDCVEMGRELNSGGARYNFTGIQGIGLATVADSLCAIKNLVLEEQKITLSELVNAAKKDFNDEEELRQTLLRMAPKFGNDDDDVDMIARKVAIIYCTEVEQYRNQRGGKFIPGMFSISAHVPFGKGTMSTDGRLKSEPLSDACSPAQGRVSVGPTGVARSVAKLDHVRVTNGTLLNVKYLASQLAKDENVARLAAFLRAFMQMGGYHVQINVVDPAMLRDAQKHPERYPHLLVRVAAYVALFTQLSKDIQDEIIARSELLL
ncbi:MAG: glycyl radical protein [Bacillota bacterium]